MSSNFQYFNSELESDDQQLVELLSEQANQFRMNSPNINDSYKDSFSPRRFQANTNQSSFQYQQTMFQEFPINISPSFVYQSQQSLNEDQECDNLSVQSQYSSQPSFSSSQQRFELSQQHALSHIKSSGNEQEQQGKGCKQSKQFQQTRQETTQPSQIQPVVKVIKKKTFKTRDDLTKLNKKASINKKFGKCLITGLRKFIKRSNQSVLLKRIPQLSQFQESKSEALCQILNFPYGSFARELAKFYLENHFYADVVKGQKKESPQDFIPRINSFLKSLSQQVEE